ncbi:tRNA (adenine(37)-N6)-methyltransferase [Oryzias latipes]|nr:tRNA (adenine(37)-N6)-methyltransferase [Oryzias latipes]
MKPPCDCCSEHIQKLNQQVSVMRKEIKNLRQMLDSSVRAFRKHLTSVQTAVSRMSCCKEEKATAPAAASPASPQTTLEQGIIQTTPIGFISSCFAMKNGTPRQPTVCGPSRAELRIQQNIFNNPQHALLGLQQFSYVWIIFLFHKNGQLSCKAKVKPPRLNGQRVGVYSTRSPHRPNALGLTLAKLDKIESDTLYLSDIDMIAGTPVLDIKPYIPDYDCPDVRMSLESQQTDSDQNIGAPGDLDTEKNPVKSDEDEETDAPGNVTEINAEVLPTKNCCKKETSPLSTQVSAPKHLQNVLKEVEAFVTHIDTCQPSCESKIQVSDSAKSKPAGLSTERPCYGVEAARWIRQPPIASLDVRFTPRAESQLAEFLPAHPSGAPGSDRPGFQFLRSTDEAASAIRGILSADPRSVYRRTRCKDRLFFFTLDTADVTCWFGEDFAEVLQVRPVQSHMKSY